MSDKMYVNAGEPDQMEVISYRLNVFKVILTGIVCFIFFPILMVFYWRRDWLIRLTHSKCQFLKAEYVILRDEYEQVFVRKVCKQSFELKNQDDIARAEVIRLLDSKQKPYSSLDCVLVGQCYIVHRKLKYLWEDDTQTLQKINVHPFRFDFDASSSKIIRQPEPRCFDLVNSAPLNDYQRSIRRLIYGKNTIVVHVSSIVKLLFTQVFSPFYVFQLFSVCLWFGEAYYYYAGCIILISIVSITMQIYQQRKMERALKTTIQASGSCSVYNGHFNDQRETNSDMLVPGDIFTLPRTGCTLHCDAVLLTGSCTVNESMLTGESIPCIKTPLPGDTVVFNIKEHSRHVLYGGTKVIQTRSSQDEPVRALVIRTGFSTTKGELVRSILYPKPLDFKFTRDSYKYVVVLALMALVGMIYTLVIMISGQESVKTCIIRTLDLVTIIIPPALPAAMTVGIVFAQRRLFKRRVYCISPRAINISGTINVFCFDKTGTLTGDGLELWGIRVVAPKSNKFNIEVNGRDGRMDLNSESPIFSALSTCHSLSVVEGELLGDPLDLKMFEFTSLTFEEDNDKLSKELGAQAIVRGLVGNSDILVGIVKQFTFTSKLQRMSVLAHSRRSGVHEVALYSKGSPEMISSLSRPETVPEDFDRVLVQYTEQGYRVLALAYKPIYQGDSIEDINNVIQSTIAQPRQELEKGLTFLGLLVLENRLKPETTNVIRQLKNAEIRPVMVTGDNMLTALSVARECEIVDIKNDVIIVSADPATDTTSATVNWYSVNRQKVDVNNTFEKESSSMMAVTEGNYCFAVTGKSWEIIRQHFAHLIPQLVVGGAVFARFSPDQKQQLIESLQELDYYVGMCGDGANDCGALMAAHAGISLSEAEASVASPFTSKDYNITCVPSLISEGRAALVTSFGIFKYMAGYSMTQFLSVCILYWHTSTLTDLTFLYEDLVLLTTLAITFCYTRPYELLVPRQPMVSLVSLAPIASLLCLIGINTGIMLLSHFYTAQQPWYEVPDPDNEGDNYNYDVTSMFLYTATHYITMGIILSKSSPFRKRIYTNIPFMINIVICTVCTIELILYPANWMRSILQLKMPPSIPYRAFIVGICTMHFFFCYIVENFFIDTIVECKLQPYLSKKLFGERLKYKLVEADMARSESRPEVSRKSLIDLMNSEMTLLSATAEPEEPESKVQKEDCLSNGNENLAFISEDEENSDFVTTKC